MISARNEYFDRVNSILNCLSEQHKYNNFLNELSPNEALHNSQARLIRSGLSISNFCFFEDFIKSRLGECVIELPNIFSDFQALPLSLQKLITLHALDSVHKRSDTIKRSKSTSEAIQFIQEHTNYIGSSFNNTSTFSTSKFSLGWSKENINYDDFNNFLSIFHVKKCNEIVKVLSSHLLSPIIDPKIEFNEISNARHRAAHVPSFNITIEDLKKNIKNTILFAFIFDYCISFSMRLFSNNDTNHLNQEYKFEIALPLYRTIIEDSQNLYTTHYQSAARSIKNFDNLLSAEQQTKLKLKNKEFFIIKQKNENFIKKWDFNF